MYTWMKIIINFWLFFPFLNSKHLFAVQEQNKSNERMILLVENQIMTGFVTRVSTAYGLNTDSVEKPVPDRIRDTLLA